MAKALPVPDLEADQSFSLAAAKVIEVRSGEFFDSASRLAATASPMPEDVHGARVSARRLRTAIEFFRPCLPGRRAKKALAEVSRLAESLSVQRDLDVWLETLFGYQKEVGHGESAGVDLLITSLLGEREQARSDSEEFVIPRLETLEGLVESLVEHTRDRAPESAGDPDSDEAAGR